MKCLRGSVNGWFLVIVVAVVVIAEGCGAGEYEKRMQAKTWARGSAGGGGGAAGAKADVPGMPATFSPPPGMELAKAPTPPPGANVPGLKATYETSIVDANKGKQYYYCYVVGADAGADAMTPVLKGLETAIQGGAQWEKKEIDDKGPDGKPIKIRTAFAKGKQKFRYVTANNEEQAAENDGVLQVWDREIQPGGAHVFIVWRVPGTLTGKQYANCEERGKAMAQSVAPKEAAPAAPK